MFKHIKVIGFDADDTLWVNEPYFREAEDKFCELLKDYLPIEDIAKQLFKTEITNLKLYGYGVKAFMLSLIETAINISNKKVPTEIIEKILDLGKQQLNKPVILLDEVEQVLSKLFNAGYKLIVATKGDLLDQERKLKKSGLEKYFHHIEIMSEKHESDYTKLLNHLEINSSEFVMIGNSVKSDILPIVAIGGKGIHVPFHTTWEHENVVSDKIDDSSFIEIKSISEVLNYL
jgi:putative hydrolase of the HAD superfamily